MTRAKSGSLLWDSLSSSGEYEGNQLERIALASSWTEGIGGGNSGAGLAEILADVPEGLGTGSGGVSVAGDMALMASTEPFPL